MSLFLKNIRPFLFGNTPNGMVIERERERERLETQLVDTLIICIAGVFVFPIIDITTIVLPWFFHFPSFSHFPNIIMS
jgi:hypothetical protein